MTVNIIGNICFYDMNIYFIIFSFLRWVGEVAFSTLKTGKFINRGFLNGPVCPIYGVGMAFCVLFLNTLTEKWYLLFIVGGVLATVLELLTGIVLEKIFKTKWWDYSNEHFNFKGYICLRFSFLWAIAITLLFYTLVPICEWIIKVIPFGIVGGIILIVFWIVFILDIITAVYQIRSLKRSFTEIIKIGEKLHGGSDKIGKKVSTVTEKVSNTVKSLSEKIKNKRLVKAFPNLKNYLEKRKNK